MPDPINLSERRNAREQPDSDCVDHDFRTDHVVTTFRFIGSYEFEGKQWGFELWATDIEQAKRKFTAMSGGQIDGQLMSIVPA